VGGGTTAFGVRVDNPGSKKERNGRPQRLVFGSSDAVETVRLIFQWYVDGNSLRAVVSRLNGAGIKTRDGNTWTVTSVRYHLTNRVYVGDFVWNQRCQAEFHGIRGGSVVAKPTKGTTDASDRIIFEDVYPAIIDRKTFDAVQERLASRSTPSTPHRNGGDFLLSGLLRCAKCKSHMYGMTIGGTQYYICGGYLHKTARSVTATASARMWCWAKSSVRLSGSA